MYKMTAAERRAYAQKKKEETRQTIANNFYNNNAKMQSVQSSAKALELDEITSQNEEQVQNNDNTLERIGYSIADVLSGVGYGLTKGLEGIFDLLLGAGVVMDEFIYKDKTFKESLDESAKVTSYDFAGDLFGRDSYIDTQTGEEKQGSGYYNINNFDTKWNQEVKEKSYIPEDSIANGVAEGVGQMLPSIVLAIATSGSSAAVQAAASSASMAYMGLSATGNATEEATNRQIESGQEVNGLKSLGYGIASGAVEVATEKIGGTVFGDSALTSSWMGKAINKSPTLSKALSKGVGKVGYTIVSEGAEEVLSDWIEPLNSEIFNLDGKEGTFSERMKADLKNQDAKQILKDAGKTFIVGGITGAVIEGMGSGASAIRNHSKGGMKYTSVANSMQNISEVMQANSLVKQTGKFSQEYVNKSETRANKVILENVETISKSMQKMTTEQRARTFEDAPMLTSFIEEDGTISKAFLEDINTQIASGQATNTTANIFDTQDIQNKLDSASESYNTKYNNSEPIKFEIDNNTFTQTERTAFSDIAQKVSSYGKKTGSDINVAIIKDNSRANAFVNGDTLFVTRKHLKDGTWATPLIHELSHPLINDVNSKQTKALALFLSEDQKAFKKAVDKVASAYGRTAEEVMATWEKVMNGKQLNARETETFQETVAHLVDDTLGNRESLNRLFHDNSSIFKRIYRGIKNLISTLKGTNVSKAEMNRLLEAERMFEDIMGETKQENEIAEKAYTKYANDKKKYESLADNKKAEWLKKNGYTAEDFESGVTTADKDVSNTSFNLATWKEKTILTPEGVKSGKEILLEQMSQLGKSESEVTKLVADLDNVATFVEEMQEAYPLLKKWNNITPHYRPDGSLMLTSVVSNGEYDLNIDFTTICKKREALALFLTEYVESGHTFGKKGYNKPAQSYLENLFRKYDLDTACSICFVESRRRNVDTWSSKFVELWNKALSSEMKKKAKPISSLKGLENIDVVNGITDEIAFDVANAMESDALMVSEAEKRYNELYNERRKDGKKHNPNTLERMEGYIKNHAEDGKIFTIKTNDLLNVKIITYIKSNFPDLYSILLTSYGSNAPKQTLPATPYASNIFYTSEFAKIADLYKKTREIGGLRLNSFSDFVITRVLDYAQLFADAQARNACLQSYTKEIAQVELFGKTNAKQNISFVPEVDVKLGKANAGLDKDGNYIMSKDSADIERAFEIQEKEGYKGDVGVCLIGISKNQILKALGDDRIKMIIPYHSSGMPKHLKIYFNHTVYTDYQKWQNTMRLKDGKLTKVDNDPFLKVFYGSYIKNEGDFRIATEDYLSYCKEKKLVPRFAKTWKSDLSFEENLKLPDNYIVAHENYYKVLIDFTSDGGVNENGDYIYKQQKPIELNFDGIDIKAILDRELKEYSKGYDKYIASKGAMFEEFQKAVNGTINAEEMKTIRDERISEENKQYTVTDDIGTKNGTRFSLGEEAEDFNKKLSDKYRSGLTASQEKKLANYTRKKVYHKHEAEKIINSIIGTYIEVADEDSNLGTITNKTKNEAIEILWRGLNTANEGKQLSVASDIAEYLIQNTTIENLLGDTRGEIYAQTIDAIKPYLHSIRIDDSLKAKIKYRFDKDNSAYLLWSSGDAHKGVYPDDLKSLLAQDGYILESGDSAQDQFITMVNDYYEAVDYFKQKTKTFLLDIIGRNEYNKLKQDISKDILRSFDEYGEKSKYVKEREEFMQEQRSKMEHEKDTFIKTKKEYFDKTIKKYSERLKEEVAKGKAVDELFYKLQKLKNIKSKQFLNASEYKSDIFKGSVEKLANTSYRYNLKKHGVRETIRGFKDWYTKENPILNYESEENRGFYDSYIAELMENLTSVDGDLTVEEINNAATIVDYFVHFINTYNKVYRNGKYVDVMPIAEEYISIAQKRQKNSVGGFQKIFNAYMEYFADPMAVARYFDGYQDGFFSQTIENFRKAEENAAIALSEMRKPIDEFLKKNKDYFVKAKSKTIKINGKEVPLLKAMYDYMLINREQALMGLAINGFSYTDKGVSKRVNGFEPKAGEMDITEVRESAKKVQDEIEKQLSETDKQYIKIAEKIFNEEAKARKEKTDMIRSGYSNVSKDYYIPIRRANIARNIDSTTMAQEMDTVSNASFNKDTVKGAKGELLLEDLNVVVDNHIRMIALYENLATSIDEFNRVYNLNTSGTKNRPVSVKTEVKNVWGNIGGKTIGGERYLYDLLRNIQGVNNVKDGATSAMNKVVGKVRGLYAQAVLSLNPKVLVTQVSSYLSAGSMLEYKSLVRGLTVSNKDVDKYCKLAMVRNDENSAAKAQANVDSKLGKVDYKVDKIRDKMMSAIGKVDRLIIRELFGACQVEVQSKEHLKIGTEENKVKAGELLSKIIHETQQNAFATDRSSAMRSSSEVLRAVTMFSADSMKGIGRFMDGLGETLTLQKRIKAETDANVKAELTKKLKQSRKKLAKATASVVSVSIFFALVSQAFRTLFAKDDEDENIVENMIIDAIGNLFGGLPIIKDAYSFFVQGYDVEFSSLSSVSDFLTSLKSLYSLIDDVINGKASSKEAVSNIKKVIFAASKVFGLPTQNLYNIVYGLIKRISPETSYKIDSVFYSQSYRSDLKKAIEDEDYDMIATIAGLMAKESIGAFEDETTQNAINDLTSKGYDVLPKSVSDSISVDGNVVELSTSDKKKFKEKYSEANERINKLCKTKAFQEASDEVKANAIKQIENTYYQLAVESIAETEKAKTSLFSKAIDVEAFALAVATAKSLEADKDKNGNAISGTKKKKVQKYIASLNLTAAQKYMIMGYIGYTNTNGRDKVISYIQSLDITKEEKQRLFAYSGYKS